MRVTDDRYWRDRRAFDLAWRLLGHAARTSTISRWTGLTERRVRSLQRSYGKHGTDAPLRRPRGRSPHRIDLLLRSPEQKRLAAHLACILRKHNVLPEARVPNERLLPGIDRGESLCSAFEEFRQRYPLATLTIEQAILLATSLARGEETDLVPCATCGTLLIVDRLSSEVGSCWSCDSTRRHDLADSHETGEFNAEHSKDICCP